MIDVVCFHVPPDDQERARLHWSLLDILTVSLHNSTPNARLTLLTTSDAVLPRDLGVDRTIRVTRRASRQLMLDEVAAWHYYIHSDAFDRPTVFLDLDMIVQRDLRDLFRSDFDVGLTVNLDPSLLSPVNAGLIAVSSRRIDKVRDFFDRYLETLQALSPSLLEWFGDQEALLQLIGGDILRGDMPNVEVAGVKVHLFKCYDWNYSEPYDLDGAPVLAEASWPAVLHFKGTRKSIMPAYAMRYFGYAGFPGSCAVNACRSNTATKDDNILLRLRKLRASSISQIIRSIID